MITREEYEQRECDLLAPYALCSRLTRGRKHAEERHPFRSDFQRDKERITYTTAFRRLEYKTQVFNNFEGDHFRTRLTHTLEVSLISRSIARSLGLNEDLVEAIALAHDLGHSPFGHAGEYCLDALMADCSGFEHNMQSLRIVEELEDCYEGFPGLNLTWEVREGLKKHSPDRFNALEFQVVNIADEIAYNAHDLEDGLRARYLALNGLKKLKIWEQISAGFSRTAAKNPVLLKALITRQLVNRQVVDIIANTEANIKRYNVLTREDLSASLPDCVCFSDVFAPLINELKGFLTDTLYNHRQLKTKSARACEMLKTLFFGYEKKPEEMPGYFTKKYATYGKRIICDYIAGMTDRFAFSEYERMKKMQ